MRRVPLRTARWLAPLAWMTLIFIGSTDVLSAHHTSRFIEPLLRWLFQNRLPPQSIERLHFLIRKTGHLTEYAVLCVLFWWALSPPEPGISPTNAPPSWRQAIRAIILAAGFAASDEFHQSFVPSRGASVEDVLIDTVGATIGLLVFLAARRLAQSLRRR